MQRVLSLVGGTEMPHAMGVAKKLKKQKQNLNYELKSISHTADSYLRDINNDEILFFFFSAYNSHSNFLGASN